jgi:GalNAc-alpha-(1->4)-GalNAc-alpha-(1->3)-diNAcBac-PP-undecaprenol alpha-1,4-N-acetyl-D-galactosaminyltransferase
MYGEVPERSNGAVSKTVVRLRTVGSNPTLSATLCSLSFGWQATVIRMTNKRKLLLTIPTLQGGGAERVMTTLANYWAALGWDITLVTYEKEGTTPFYDVHASIHLIQINALSLNPFLLAFDILKRIWKMRRIMRQTSPQAVVSFMDMNNVLTTLAARGLGIPVCISERVDPQSTPISFVKKILRDGVYTLADAIIVQTERISVSLPNFLKKCTRVIENPIAAQQVSLNYEAKNIIAVGRLCGQKGFNSLIEAFGLLPESCKDWILTLWGEGEDRAKLESLIQEKGLEKKVKLPGATKNIFQEMAKGSIFILSSRFEGMPNALCEAMALGLAVVSTDCPTGPRELITPFEDGLLVPVDDVKALAEAMALLMQDPKMRKSFGEKASLKMKKYSIHHISSLWEKVFEEVLA